MTTSSFAMRVLAVGMVVAVGATVSCGGSKTSPTSVATPVTSASVLGPTAILRINSDLKPALGLVGGSLTFDASESVGAGLTYSIDFGDGEKSGKAVETHLLKSGGAKTAKLTVTDAQARSSSIEVPYFAAAVGTGAMAWQTSLNGRTISLIFQQTGASISGTYFETGYGASKTFAGMVSGDRHLNLRTDDGTVTLDGVIEWTPSSCLALSCVSMRLVAQGGTANGATPLFTSVEAATPIARLSIPSDVQPVFGFPGYTAFAFDATSSAGLDLTYRLKFGDGDETSQAQASHTTMKTGSRVAELIVTDRFGRTASTTARYGSIGLQSGWLQYYANASYDVRVTASGSQLSGEIIDRTVTPNRFLPATGSLTGARGLSFRSDDGTVTLDGTFEITTWYDPACTVAPNYMTCLNVRATVRGGALNGQTLVFRWYDGT